MREVQIAAQLLVTVHELRPGDAAVEEIGGDRPARRPAFEMRAANLRLERDAAAGDVETIAEVDVFDRRPPEPFVEAADAMKRRGAHRAEAAPERHRVAARLAVYERVRQILHLRHEAVV